MIANRESLVETLMRGEGGAQTAETGRPVQALAWVRVSTDKQKRDGFSIDQQIREIRQMADQRGIHIVKEYGEACSAYQRDSKRIEFMRMLEDARKNPDVSAILVHDMSRFTRDDIDGKSLVRKLRDDGVAMISVNDPEYDPDSVSGIYMEAITFAKNKAFSREIAMHTRKGCRANIRARDPGTGLCYKNGGQPPWGYKIQHVERTGDGGRILKPKSIWILDDTIVAGRPTHEWVRHCLVEIAAKGASLAELRDFCNDTGIPGRRKPYWQITTWNALLKTSVILQFTGTGVWNVHTKKGRIRPMEEWEIVDNAHPAIISEEEARNLLEARKIQSFNKKGNRFPSRSGRSRQSPYLLSGGLFKCKKCDSNMTGIGISGGYKYYICGSQQYRKGEGCVKPAVYVPKELAESAVIEGIRDLFQLGGDLGKLTALVNRKLKAAWKAQHESTKDSKKKLEKVDQKIADIHTSIENGLKDVAWANSRLDQLQEERRKLAKQLVVASAPPTIDQKTVSSYMGGIQRLLGHASLQEKKRLIRTMVKEIKLAPEEQEVTITYYPPRLFVDNELAGTGFEPMTFGL